MSPSADRLSECPLAVTDSAAEVVEYVKRAVGLVLEYDSDTLPILDHYLRSVPDEPGAATLVATTAGAYFGEVVRRSVGGRWDAPDSDAETWRMVLPGGLSFSPFAVVLNVIFRDDSVDASLQAPPKMRPHVEAVLDRMADVTEDNYYSLCCRLDTIEHVQAVLLAIAAKEAERRKQATN